MAMGSPFLRFSLTSSWRNLRRKSSQRYQTPPTFWGRYVDDTEVVVQKKHEDELFQHINKQHKRIRFTIEQEGDDNSLPMLDIQMIRENGSITMH